MQDFDFWSFPSFRHLIFLASSLNQLCSFLDHFTPVKYMCTVNQLKPLPSWWTVHSIGSGIVMKSEKWPNAQYLGSYSRQEMGNTLARDNKKRKWTNMKETPETAGTSSHSFLSHTWHLQKTEPLGSELHGMRCASSPAWVTSLFSRKDVVCKGLGYCVFSLLRPVCRHVGSNTTRWLLNAKSQRRTAGGKMFSWKTVWEFENVWKWSHHAHDGEGTI